MPYMLLIHEPVGQRQARNEAEGHAVYERMLKFADRLKQRRVLLGVESLSSQSQATRIKVSNGRPQAECPAAEWATIEVRATGPCYT